jgi:xanthine dehydrogenase accessory factor
MTALRALIIGGGDIGSAVAMALFRQGLRVLVAERAGSPHARRGMAFTDALFDGVAVLEGVTARRLQDIAGLEECWDAGDVIPVTTVPESELMEIIRFDVLVDATMRRKGVPPDRRTLTGVCIGLGPGYVPGHNCHVAIETQWGEFMGRVLRDQPPAERSGGPRPLAGIARERFAIAPRTGLWRTEAALGQAVQAGAEVGRLDGLAVQAPISGHLRGLTRDGVEVTAGQRLLEVDPRTQPQIFGLGERPAAIAAGVAEALGLPGSGEG